VALHIPRDGRLIEWVPGAAEPAAASTLQN